MYQVRNGRNGLFLTGCCGAQKRAGGDKENIPERSALHIAQDFGTQYRRAAATSGSAGMNVLPLAVVNHQATVIVHLPQIYALLPRDIIEVPAPDQPQIARQYQVVIRR